MGVTQGVRNFRLATTPPPFTLFYDGVVCLVQGEGLYVVVKMEIPDLLHNSPKTAQEIAMIRGARDPNALYRILRALASWGYLNMEPGNANTAKFSNNHITNSLRRNHPDSVRSMFILFYEHLKSTFDNMYNHVMTGEFAWGTAHPEHPDFYKFIYEQPDTRHLFVDMMAQMDSMGMTALVEDVQWDKCQRVIDLGTSGGSVIFRVLQEHDHLTAIGFDLPDVITLAEHNLAESYPELSDRVQFVGGDFFAEVPKAQPGDCYTVRNVLHDWDDGSVSKIFDTVFRATEGVDDAQLIILEQIVEEGPMPAMEGSLPTDLIMLLVHNSKQRTVDEFGQLLAESGLKLNSFHSTRSPYRALYASQANR
jgi:hypothetical protein